MAWEYSKFEVDSEIKKLRSNLVALPCENCFSLEGNVLSGLKTRKNPNNLITLPYALLLQYYC